MSTQSTRARESASPIRIVALLREQEIATELGKAFAERYLPEHLFYWLPSSLQAWVNLCRSTEYRNASRALEVLRTAGPELAASFLNTRTLCGIGCGEGSKDRILLEAWAGAGRQLNFVAADFSQGLLELALDQVEVVTASATAYKIDVFNDSHLDTIVSDSRRIGAPAMFSVLGNTLGAFGAKEFPHRLRRALRPEDRFLFDGEIFSSEATLSGYDNPTNRRFAWGPLTGVGITEEDGKLEFSTSELQDGLRAVTKRFTASRDLRINVGGELIEISAGETLRMSSSIKYVNEAALLASVEAAGFQTYGKWNSSDGKFVLACAKPA